MLSKGNLDQKTASKEWMSTRNALRDHEQTYYDFIGEETRWRVYEHGFANNVDWNKTMGNVQENFFRVLSCVTLLDQVKVLISKSLIPVDSSQLASEAKPVRKEILPDIARGVSSENGLNTEDLQ